MRDARFRGQAPNEPVSYLDRMRRAQGFLAETCPRIYSSGATVITSGGLYFTQIYLKAGETLTNCHASINSLPVSCTLIKIGLWNLNGVLLASCADQSAAWISTGLKSQALLSPYTPTISGTYYVGILTIASGSTPNVHFTGASASATYINSTQGIIGKPQIMGVQTGLSDLPNPIAPTAGIAPVNVWIAFT